MRVRTGTSGFSYKAWKGSFYPEDLDSGEMLSYYAGRLGAVEINNTFYRMPKESVLTGWADAVGDDFRFALKVSRKITHFKRLKDCDDERLSALLDILPPRCRAAFEFRHDSWFDEAVYDLLRGHSGATLCIAETDERRWEKLPETADWGYLRLRRDDYTEADVDAWAERIGRQPWDEALAFFKHEDAGAGPRLAERLAESVAQ